MKTAVQVTAHNNDKTENVYFDTTVTHRSETEFAEIERRAIMKCKTMLRRDHPELLAELTEFSVAVQLGK